MDVGIELGIGKLELYIFDTMCLDALEFDPQFDMVFSQQQTTTLQFGPTKFSIGWNQYRCPRAPGQPPMSMAAHSLAAKDPGPPQGCLRVCHCFTLLDCAWRQQSVAHGAAWKGWRSPRRGGHGARRSGGRQCLDGHSYFQGPI